MKKRSAERRKHCALAAVRRSEKSPPPQIPFPGAQDRQNLISWTAGDGHYLHLQTQFGEDRCMQFRAIVVTDTARPPQTHRQDRLKYTAPLASAQCYKLSVRTVSTMSCCRLTMITVNPAAPAAFNQWVGEDCVVSVMSFTVRCASTWPMSCSEPWNTVQYIAGHAPTVSWIVVGHWSVACSQSCLSCRKRYWAYKPNSWAVWT